MTSREEGQGKTSGQDLWSGKTSPAPSAAIGGGDFQAVLQEIAGIADETAAVPLPPKNKWAEAGCIMGDTFSIAWRTLNAEYWGVPQRRKRIFLVADFGGLTAPKVVFERKGLRREVKECREAWQGITGNSERSAHAAGRNSVVLENHPQDSRVTFAKDNIVPTLTGQMGTGGATRPSSSTNYSPDQGRMPGRGKGTIDADR